MQLDYVTIGATAITEADKHRLLYDSEDNLAEMLRAKMLPTLETAMGCIVGAV